MAKKMVMVTAIKLANTVVRTENGRAAIFTNPDKEADAAHVEDGGASAYQFPVTEDVAAQLEKKKVVKIGGEASGDEAEIQTAAKTGRKKVAENADADNEVDGVSGADTRDTTAFTTDPLTENAAPAAEETSTEAADADAPPADDSETETKTPAKKAPAKK